MKKNILSAAFSGLAIFFLGLLGAELDRPVLVAPLAATCVLLFGFPESPLARPKNIVLGHLLCSLIGLVLFQVTIFSPLTLMAFGVALAVLLMALTGTSHPAAAAYTILIIQSGAGSGFLLFAIATGLLVLIGMSFVHRHLT